MFFFDTDRNANRWHQNPAGQGAQLSFDATTNHVAGGNGVTYDAAGNITNDGICAYTYDAEYRITAVDACSTASYVYDALGRRVRKTVGGSSTDYFYDISGNKVAELQGSTWLRMDFHVAGSHLGSYQGTRTYFSHQDWEGTERLRTNDAGGIAQSCTSNPYGENWNCTNGGYTSQISFAGMELDNESQLYHTLYRYYNPRLGLWMTTDPAGMAASNLADPQSLNRYAYVRNAPTNFFDPLGLIWVLFENRFCVNSGGGDHCKSEFNWVWLEDGGGGGGFGGGGGVNGGGRGGPAFGGIPNAPAILQYRTQDCLNNFHHTTAGKLVQLGSLTALTPADPEWKSNWKETLGLGTLKALSVGGATHFGKGVIKAAGRFIENGAAKVAAPLLLTATALDTGALLTCSAGAVLSLASW